MESTTKNSLKNKQFELKKLFFLTFIVISLSYNVFCQIPIFEVWKSNYIFIQDSTIQLFEKKAFNGLTISFGQNSFTEGYAMDDNGRKYLILQDHHVLERNQSTLLFFSAPIHSIHIEFHQGGGPVEFIFQHVEPLKKPILFERMNLSQNTNCDEPQGIPQSVWRDGLPKPKPGRTSTVTHHCIIHHSASSNLDTNTIDLVRAFYIQHTEVNGWDDIGYNYLIGHDGTLVFGRDPENADIQQDNVLGAHFCGKNSNTMGACVIGDFTNVTPTDAAINTVKHLIVWKFKKDFINPLQSTIHPFNPGNGALLGNIAGHRDGCATSCPGDQLYKMLDKIRNEVDSLIQNCFQIAVSSIMKNERNEYQCTLVAQYMDIEHLNPKNSQIEIHSVQSRQFVEGWYLSENKIFLESLFPGVYILKIKRTNSVSIIPFIKI